MLGWLHVTPEGEKQTRAQLSKWPLPDCEAWAYIVAWFCELRLQFGFQDIESWMNITGSQPNPNEIELLISMSGAYSNALIEYRGKDHNLIPPYDGRTPEEISEMVSANMKRSLARFR
jgi:hypothetical protein